MKKKMNDQREKRQRLVEQVERLVHEESLTPVFDVEDDDILGYVDDLIRSCSQAEPNGRFSLKTQEEALRAITIIERTQAAITTHLRTARALRALLNTRSETVSDGQ